jgi:SSS family solute:Na+ symporter
MLAALLSAAMSSLDADLNSLGSVVVDDFYGRLRPKATDRQRLWVGKLVVIVMGIAATVMSLQFVGIRSFIETTVSLFSWIAGGMLGLFVLGFCFRRATAAGAYAGISAGVLFTVWAAATSVKLPSMAAPLLNLGPLNYSLTPYLIGVFTHLIVVGVGLTASFVAGKPTADAERLTIWHREMP